MRFSGPSWLTGMPSVVEKLSNGESVAVGNKIYVVCRGCNRVICLNKSFFGSVHFCEN